VPGAQFWFPEVDLGVPLNIGSTARLCSMVGASRAKEIILLCERFKAEELLAWGMVHRLVPPDQLMDTARALATRLLAKSPRAVTGSKLTINTIAAVAAREPGTVHPELFIHSQEA
jgi:enoyl-CoA hydratase/carnithine racemase